MTTPPPSPRSFRFPTFNRFSHWIFSWRTLGRALVGVAALITLAGLFYAEENWRCRRAWDQYRRGFETRGIRLDYQVLVPKPVPDEQNFAATPTIVDWFEKPGYSDSFQRKRDSFWLASNRLSTGRPTTKRQFMDLSAWNDAFLAVLSNEPNSRSILMRRYNLWKHFDVDPRSEAIQAAQAVLQHLRANDAMFAELRAASRRPFSRFPIIYDLENPWGILLPHLAKIKDVCLRLQLKACAELAADQSENALEDVKLALFMTDSVKEEPFLISYLVRLECLQIAIQPVWEGLIEHRWSEIQLEALQKRFLSYNFVEDLQRTLAAEPAAAVLTADLLFQGKYRLSQLADIYGAGDVISEAVTWFAPHGWFYMEKLNYCRLFSTLFETGIDPEKKQILPNQIESNRREFERLLSSRGSRLDSVMRHQALAEFLLTDLHNAPRKSAQAQTTANQAALACGLEQYRLARGRFPDTLDSLSPQFVPALPNDVLNGQAYHYRRTDDARFVLYSVGWDGKDDGGRQLDPATRFSISGLEDVRTVKPEASNSAPPEPVRNGSNNVETLPAGWNANSGDWNWDRRFK